MVKGYKYFLFDLDGTLIDTKDMIYLSFDYVLGKYLGRSVSKEEIDNQVGIPLRTIMEKYFSGSKSEKIQEIIQDFHVYQRDNLADTVTLFPGISEVLQVIIASRKKCGVVTSRSGSSTKDFLKRLGLESMFPVCVTVESTTHHKPHPEPVEYAMSLLGVQDPSEVLFVGDSEFDIEAGTRARVDTALALWGLFDSYEALVQPKYFLRSPEDLLSYCVTVQ
ncbi:MAG: HAD-IA family hydrolase [SAR324 cluster bacterium]|uniref:HAD-IA family hydrolase n=1 Tax=SAR324 cluster bacterium TaxID=2024889 RepID=A0A7X9IL44_9DELT|nr:HAD-IA family hydrolase [SAR324 cluster bacterium]